MSTPTTPGTPCPRCSTSTPRLGICTTCADECEHTLFVRVALRWATRALSKVTRVAPPTTR